MVSCSFIMVNSHPQVYRDDQSQSITLTKLTLHGPIKKILKNAPILCINVVKDWKAIHKEGKCRGSKWRVSFY